MAYKDQIYPIGIMQNSKAGAAIADHQSASAGRGDLCVQLGNQQDEKSAYQASKDNKKETGFYDTDHRIPSLFCCLYSVYFFK